MLRATLIGDVVSSREAADRPALHAEVTGVLAAVNRRLRPVEPLRITIGDEYQGVFGRVGDAVRASLALRLAAHGQYDVRHGLGWGEVTVLEVEPPVQDGPGWWAARQAIEAVHAQQQRPGTRWRRTAFRAADPSESAGDGVAELAAAVESAMVMRDQLLDGLDARSVSVLDGLLRGETQREIAERLAISASAVSQRIRADGLGGLVLGDEVWKENP